MSLVSDSEGQLLRPADGARAALIAQALRRAARQSRVPVFTISGGGGFRARKSDKLFWRAIIGSFILLVAVPVIVASIYLGALASDQYSTEARLALRNGDSSLLDQLSGLAGLPSSQQYQDSQIIVDYITSRAMVEKINDQLDLRRVYGRSDADWWARFNAKKPTEDLEKYWRWRVDVSIEQSSSIISLNVRAFSPEDSLAIARKIIENSEDLVNRLTERGREDALRDTRAELSRAEARLVAATLAMRDERNNSGVIDGEATSTMVQAIVTPLRLQLAKYQQELAVQARTVRADAPQVRRLNLMIENLNATIASYMNQIANGGGAANGGDETLADRMQKLSRRQSDVDVAQKLYASSAVAYETARIDAEAKHSYLLPFMKPTQAQKALYPRRWLNWILIAFPAILIWAIVAGLGALVRDHMAS